MTIRHPLKSSRALPGLWLISDARNDAVLDKVLLALPPGSGVVFRHYHLPLSQRRARFERLKRIGRRRGHVVALSGPAEMARRWGADAIYGAPPRLQRRAGLARLATVHSLLELAAAHRAGADTIFLSPIFETRSHPGGGALGPLRAATIAQRSLCPVILLGGMTEKRWKRMRALPCVDGWAAIDGLSTA